MAASQIECIVPVLTGNNYVEWEALMKAYLQSQGYWLYVNTIQRPDVKSDQVEWDLRDAVVNGTISLRLAKDVRAHLGATSALTWINLSRAYATDSPFTVYQDLKESMTFKLGGRSPLEDISRLEKQFERLRANKIIIPDYIQGMMLLKAVPETWENFEKEHMQSVKKAQNVTFANVKAAITAGFRHKGGQPPSSGFVTVEKQGKTKKEKVVPFEHQQSAQMPIKSPTIAKPLHGNKASERKPIPISHTIASTSNISHIVDNSNKKTKKGKKKASNAIILPEPVFPPLPSIEITDEEKARDKLVASLLAGARREKRLREDIISLLDAKNKGKQPARPLDLGPGDISMKMDKLTRDY